MQSVYIALNFAYEGLCKIGYSKHSHPAPRLRDLYTTGVLHPFELYFFVVTKNGRFLESKIHKFFNHCRYKNEREFFIIDPESAKKVLIMLAKEISEDDEVFSLKEEQSLLKRKRANNINLYDLGLNFGDSLYFTKDCKIECMVYSDKTVLFRGEELTLTEAARKTGIVNFKEIQGSRYWTFQGKSLVNLRKEKELFI